MSSEATQIRCAAPHQPTETVAQKTPPGFRRTEAGAIPVDWDVERIDAHALIKTGGKNTQDRVVEGRYPFFVRSQQVESINSYSYDGEAVLTAGDGVGTGKVYHYINGRFDVHQRVYRISDFSDRLSGRYFFYQFSARFYERIMSMTAKSSVDSVRMEMIAGMQIPLPKPTEQRAIAEALSDVDGLLGALEALIAKKRAIKQAAMQQLLTGKTRLPGFSGEWETKSLEEVATRITGYWGAGGPSEQATNPVGVIRAGDISPLGELTGFAQRYFSDSELAKAACRIGDVVMTVSGNGLGKTWLVDRREPLAASNFVRILRANATYVAAPFLSYALKGDTATRLLAENTATSAYPNLRPGFFSTVWLDLPPIAEQSAIATVLSDMDAEVAALEACRDKTRQIKQGMMQQLLTGRVRLVKSQAVA